MQEDFPAAHSMDSSWFGVDKHGHVGYFDTGEAGAMPMHADSIHFASVTEDLCAAPLEFYVDDLTSAADGAVFRVDWRTPWNRMTEDSLKVSLNDLRDSLYGALLWLRDEESLALLEELDVLRLPNHKFTFIWVDELPAVSLQQWHNTGVVLRAWLATFFPPPERFGIFHYDHGRPFENWISGPYIRSAAPAQAVRVDALPLPLRQQLEAIRFPKADFSMEKMVQPVEHVECASWQTTWIDCRGEERSIGESLTGDEGAS